MIATGNHTRRVAFLFAALFFVLQMLPLPCVTLRVQAAPEPGTESTVFDPAYYAETYPDVKAAFGNDAAQLWLHYRMFGEKEGRSAAPSHTPGTKVSAPAGVRELPIPTLAAPAAKPPAGQTAAAQTPAPADPVATTAAAPASVTFDPAFYAARYADVKAAFGSDAAKLWLHYRMFGEKEGRLAAANAVPGVTKVTAPKGVQELAIPNAAAAAAAPAAPVFQPGGRRVAFIGDSITTYEGQIPPTYAAFYPKPELNRLDQTWWYQVMVHGGMQLAVNASWTGSCVSGNRNDTSGAVGSGQGRIRTVVAQAPNIVFITMGICDFGWNIKPAEFRESYVSLVSQLRAALPNAFIICCTCVPAFIGSRNEGGYTVEEYNSVIRRTAGEYGCYLIDTANCGLTRAQTMDDLHPTAEGAAVIANYVLAHMPQFK
ncbi:MAG: SGNH/GDSL hydrolase family protein [Lachnospiraceae bacterium]|nr:SGNH/GDSL hydrolase family protein [Lachnospiraceae bacterium]